MKRALTLTTAMIVALALPAMAENVPGAHFIENWDLDESGGVTLEEARERRGDIFTTFDADEDGIMSDEEYDMFDEAREADMKENGIGQGMGQGGNGQGQNQGQGQKQGQGQGKGMGQGKGQGHGKGQGQGGGMGPHSAAMAMTRQNADTNGDGTVTREEFVAGTDAWFVKQDRNGDGTITAEDFGRGN
ncbi:hypothetical protein [Aliiroseovarius subalbicans]|uniref:hypothetical protein n=1 Tax=Aliiroseovarius subalbicans TaxID=2925840 RepID=UPI001F58DD99|nr:hypothetical protein [Aliiroseovarius subalbicans]MCI2400577.1 hypothetical protein [Aliiroseovarius subalbicans]